VLRPIFHLDRLLVQIEAQRFLLFDISASNADEESIITVRDRMNVTFRILLKPVLGPDSL